MPARLSPIVCFVLSAIAWPAVAQEPRPEPAPPAREEAAPMLLDPLTVTAPPPVSSSSQILIPHKDFELRPQGRPADILRLVPGFVIGQHAGGGKADQYFLRGFDADHGTDVAFFVDGAPVNLRSHAHGQGYADLHFLIPEVVKQVEAYKGPYYVEFGDFATAGAFNFTTLDLVEENLIQAGGGTFDTQRYLTLLSPTRGRVKTLFAAEGYFTDGPYDRSQNYSRLNFFGKASSSITEDLDVAVWASYLDSKWFGSGQIPLRAVREGLISRFGAIDDSEGGDTRRAIVNADLRWRPSDTQQVSVHAYGQWYTLDLFSNFTFFLNDEDNGDGIEQVDRRFVLGLDTAYQQRFTVWERPLIATAGFQVRADFPRVILARQADRHRLGKTQDVDIREVSYSPYLKLDVQPLSWLRLIAGARGDIFTYDVQDNLGGDLDGRLAKAIPSAKVSTVLGPWYQTELFANFGTGFHSNDARAVVQDPTLTALPQALGWEVGFKSQALRNVEVSGTFWQLDLDSELVFVGDEGTVEPRGPSRRRGIELAARWQALEWLLLTGDVTMTQARFKNGDAVPLAPRFTARGDVTVRFPWGLSASLAVRYLANRYLTEDRQEKAQGYTLLDFTARYRLGPVEAFLTIENLTNTEYREAQFFFTSRLRGEPAAGVDDVHFTPGNPRSVLGGLALHF